MRIVFYQCPNCLNNNFHKQCGNALPYIAECEECGQLFCPKCGNHSFWFGGTCPKCKSTKSRDIGRIQEKK
ncbi:MAG: hypothetical protein B6I26_00510 [Desulfobacteraceae bacterium 4572_130]|nr:MAG: hypothetical protein B6I26_00510 [Desulfobacteraceae bacterium 4572_130]